MTSWTYESYCQTLLFGLTQIDSVHEKFDFELGLNLTRFSKSIQTSNKQFCQFDGGVFQ